MARFFKDSLSEDVLSEDKNVVRVRDIVELISDSDYREDMLELFEIDSIENEPILIPGLKTIIHSITTRDREFEKNDVECDLTDVSCVDANDQHQLLLSLNSRDGSDPIIAETAYSSKRDYLETHYKLDKFASFCMSNGHVDLLQSNITQLNQRYSQQGAHPKSFRLLKDRDDKFFIRTITSVKQYKDYNIRFSLFATIMAIHNAMKANGYKFEIARCEYSESFIKVYFKKDSATIVPNVGRLNFVIEMSNDEIKRESFKFSGLFTLYSDKVDTQIMIKPPKKIKSNWLSIRHSYKPETLVNKINTLSSSIATAESELIEDISIIGSIDNADRLRHYLLVTLERSNNTVLKDYKKEIRRTLDVKINHISQLIELMGKVDKIVDDFELKEYLRYLYYDILRDKKKS